MFYDCDRNVAFFAEQLFVKKHITSLFCYLT